MFSSTRRADGADESMEIPDVMFNTARLRERNFYDEILLGLARQPLQQVDSAVSHGVRRILLINNSVFNHKNAIKKRKSVLFFFLHFA